MKQPTEHFHLSHAHNTSKAVNYIKQSHSKEQCSMALPTDPHSDPIAISPK